MAKAGTEQPMSEQGTTSSGGLTLSMLRQANSKRQVEWCDGRGTPDGFEALELAGEVGELCNLIKKLLRAQWGFRGGIPIGRMIRDIRHEMADVLICLDLVARRYNIDLEDAVVEKFNLTSEKYGLSVVLDIPPDPSPDPGLLAFAKWAHSQLVGDSGTGESHWEQYPEFVNGVGAIIKAEEAGYE